MILLNDIGHISTRPTFTSLRKKASAYQITNRSDVGPVFIHIDDARWNDIGLAQDFPGKPLGRSDTASLVEEKIKRLPGRINCAIQKYPLASDLDVCFIDTPRIVGFFR